MARSEAAPMCGICGNEMTRLKRLGAKKYTPVFACNAGEPRKPPCDGSSARLGSKF